MSQFELEGQSAVRHALTELINSINNLQTPLERIGDYLENEIQLGINEGHTPWGEAYEPLKCLRSNNRDSRISDVPLNDTRQHIYNKITHQADSEEVIVGLVEDALIPATHKFGSDTNNITARPFLPMFTAAQAA